MIERLELFRFRSHTALNLTFTGKKVAIVGPNGIGKTNILEAISYLTLGRSFRTDHLREVLQENASIGRMILHFSSPLGKQTLRYTFGEEKEILLDATTYKNFTPLLGMIPVGIVCPRDVVLIEGGPQARRKYLNQILCQAYPEYAHHLKRLLAILQQKNAALKQGAFHLLDPFDALLEESGHIVQKQRQALLQELNHWISQEIASLLPKHEGVELTYQPSIFQRTQLNRQKEIDRQTTLFGPQRDNFDLLLNGKEASLHASEGQKRGVILALRFAELEALKRYTQQDPLLLIDDFGAHLDGERKERLLARTHQMQQVILTSPTAPHKIDQVIDLEKVLYLPS